MTRLEDFEELPTIMDASQELEVMHVLMQMPSDYIAANEAAFASLIVDLNDSHVGGGAFGLTRSNETKFFEFADWLETQIKRLGLDIDPGYSDNFRVSFDTMVAAFPTMAWSEGDPGDTDTPRAVGLDPP